MRLAFIRFYVKIKALNVYNKERTLQMKPNQTQSYLMLIDSMFIFGTMGIFRRYIPLSSGMLAFFRGILGGIVVLIAALIKKRNITQRIGRKKLLLLILSGAILGINWIMLFEAYRYTTVATATLCYYMAPTIVMLLSPLIFKEKLTIKRLICAFAALGGMILVSGVLENGMIGNEELIGVAFALGGAVLDASLVIINKKVTIDDIYQKTIIQLFSAAIILIPYLLLTETFSGITLTPFSIAMILIVGFVHSGFAYVLFYGSMDGLSSQSIAVLSYVDPVTAVFVSAFILNEPTGLLGWIGAICIIGSSVISEIRFEQKTGSL